MTRAIVLLAFLLPIMLSASSASAEQVVSGTVVRVDPAGVIYLDNRQMVNVTMKSVIFAPTRPVPLGELQHGTLVVVRSASGRAPVIGTVARVDPSAGALVFADGKPMTITKDMTVLAPTQRVALRKLEPGTFIVTGVDRPAPYERAIASPFVVPPADQGFASIVKLPRAIPMREPEYVKYALRGDRGDTVAAGIRLEQRPLATPSNAIQVP